MNEDVVEDSELPKSGSSLYIKGTEFVGKIIPATITKTGVSKFSDGTSARTIFLKYKDASGQTVEKQLSLNKTNTNALADGFKTKKVKEWIGRAVQITSTKVNNPKTKATTDGVVVIPTS